VLFIAGVIPILRFLYFWSIGDSGGHVQSLVLGGVLVILGCVTFLVGLVADLINFNRQLIEITLEKVRRLERSWPTTLGHRSMDERRPMTPASREDTEDAVSESAPAALRRYAKDPVATDDH
jgi:hypothetical protein